MTIYTTTIAKTTTLPVDWEKLPEVAREKIIRYGVQRVFNDMIGDATRFPTTEDKVAHAKAQIERYYAGDIGRTAASGASAEVRVARAEARRLLKAKLDGPDWAKFTGLEEDKQAEKLDAIVAKNEAHFKKFVAAEMKARAEAAAKRAQAAGELDISL